MFLNQWRSTKDAIDWFKTKKEKHLHKFIGFNIKDFFLSIYKSIFTETILRF